MSAQIKKNEEIMKRLHDLFRDAPEIGHVESKNALDIARRGQKLGINKEEITADLLASIDSPEDLEQLAAAGYIGPNKKFPVKRRI